MIELKEYFSEFNDENYNKYVYKIELIKNFFASRIPIYLKIQYFLTEIVEELSIGDKPVKFEFLSEQILPLSISETNILYKYAIGCLSRYKKYSSTINQYRQEILYFILKSFQFISKSYPIFVEYFNQDEKLDQITSYQLQISYQSFHHSFYPIVPILDFLNKIGEDEDFFDQFYNLIMQELHKKFQSPIEGREYRAITNLNDTRYVSIKDMDDYLAVLSEWIDYWRSNYNPPYDPQIFVYYLSHYLGISAGLFRIASPPGSNKFNTFSKETGFGGLDYEKLLHTDSENISKISLPDIVKDNYPIEIARNLRKNKTDKELSNYSKARTILNLVFKKYSYDEEVIKYLADMVSDKLLIIACGILAYAAKELNQDVTFFTKGHLEKYNTMTFEYNEMENLINANGNCEIFLL